jgi:putative transcriptional regulator
MKPTRVTITPEVLDEIRRTGVDWPRVRGMTEDEIERAIASDPDAASPMTDAEITAARVQWVRRRTGL